MGTSVAVTKHLLMPDTHVPYHDKQALKVFLKAAEWWKPDVLENWGDLADFYAISRFRKSMKRNLHVAWEIKEVNKVLDVLDDLGIRKKRMRLGNHEKRMQNYIEENAPAFEGMHTIEQEFRLKERGWEWAEYQVPMMMGKVYTSHDADPKNVGPRAHERAVDFYGGSAIIGHTHRLAMTYSGSASGKTHVGAMIGHLADVAKCDYLSKVQGMRNWHHGFGIAYVEKKTKITHVQLIPIINRNRCCIEGHVITL